MLHGVLHLLGMDHETDTGQMKRPTGAATAGTRMRQESVASISLTTLVHLRSRTSMEMETPI